MTEPPMATVAIRRTILIATLAVFALTPVLLVATGHSTIRRSFDTDQEIALFTAIAPSLVALLLIRLLPPAVPCLHRRLTVAQVAQLPRQAYLLIALALAAPSISLLGVVAGIGPYPALHVVKVVLFLLIPWLWLRRDEAGLGFSAFMTWWPHQRWRQLWPLPVVGAFAYLYLFSPVAPPRAEVADVSLAFVIVAAALTILTANLLEELFYRVMLQSRLELLLGRWSAIGLSALLFSLLHVPSHIQGTSLWSALPLTVGTVIAFQGCFGLFMGYLWSRYRNIAVLVLAHSTVNTIPLLLS
ncbi:CPBP family intramembrane glutamic endopeptidase [Natronoglycomyces albus]|uniref:CPBP family intramembrane metalloprotease n=1 Tax=Natronoglycomyces albus TaxID=2811108 RepID=A0A895XS30_9ACTN|nr:CPBP family intramembrane glutamic endopeptidase [Natronoglycomyces albus]QSB06323.1 CPBP family intramembrane metalloprotease [Natronoglycomyces albus]